ncbi:hypothetical protein L6452_08933 [Arctium lappa]|uniref:Uncharacterized protein n=1 Tax=Arctium lappa TaxID=4217 RepID=A0ACB9DIL0_ARCLA|nr:hypothetical protein L6452_08933 [Arctium lappa]
MPRCLALEADNPSYRVVPSGVINFPTVGARVRSGVTIAMVLASEILAPPSFSSDVKISVPNERSIPLGRSGIAFPLPFLSRLGPLFLASGVDVFHDPSLLDDLTEGDGFGVLDRRHHVRR